MSKYRNKLPQLSGDFFLTDAGLETDLIFNHGIEIREFAAHTLLPNPHGRDAVANYLRGFLSLANKYETGFVLDSQTWKAHLHWAKDLVATEKELHDANKDAIAFIAEFFDDSLKTADEAEKKLGLPVLVSISDKEFKKCI